MKQSIVKSLIIVLVYAISSFSNANPIIDDSDSRVRGALKRPFVDAHTNQDDQTKDKKTKSDPIKPKRDSFDDFENIKDVPEPIEDLEEPVSGPQNDSLEIDQTIDKNEYDKKNLNWFTNPIFDNEDEGYYSENEMKQPRYKGTYNFAEPSITFNDDGDRSMEQSPKENDSLECIDNEDGLRDEKENLPRKRVLCRLDDAIQRAKRNTTETYRRAITGIKNGGKNTVHQFGKGARSFKKGVKHGFKTIGNKAGVARNMSKSAFRKVGSGAEKLRGSFRNAVGEVAQKAQNIKKSTGRVYKVAKNEFRKKENDTASTEQD
ncbi:hypothetical protein BdWA1_000309 [Babesia duncani]|uniref:Uncharacterized protein n=1 Tax=Babesia duncani TaxID=323732 RepID=A0AAD9PMD5_9APIC|nr:hypothetical protein BdWA1_000309 [Babesia duncani]